ncbi:gp53-like domain-containing protein [Escherichia coli]|uniref:gp53-like domain-containing protein n=2 Tax=Escherichia coli TaxID=562 RepID=UPI003AF36E6A
MAKNDFKAFATDRNANVMSQEEWEALPALISGFTAGKASSAQVNKVIRQASFIAAALAQFVSDKTQRDVLDNGDLPGFVELLGSGFAVEYLSRKNPFGDIKSDGTVQTALENLQLKSAAQRDVGTGANQIPDMNSFHISTSQTGWCKFPNGLILQWGLTPTIFASGSVSYPIPFPGGCLFVGKNTYSPVAEKTAVFEIVNPSMTGFTAANIGSLTQGSSTFNAPIPSGMAFFAIGY